MLAEDENEGADQEESLEVELFGKMPVADPFVHDAPAPEERSDMEPRLSMTDIRALMAHGTLLPSFLDTLVEICEEEQAEIEEHPSTEQEAVIRAAKKVADSTEVGGPVYYASPSAKGTVPPKRSRWSLRPKAPISPSHITGSLFGKKAQSVSPVNTSYAHDPSLPRLQVKVNPAKPFSNSDWELAEMTAPPPRIEKISTIQSLHPPVVFTSRSQRMRPRPSKVDSHIIMSNLQKV